ncbi:DUF6090 family protein [Lutimonas sp.]|uniref:DUF6090 family protein n=1 Tax=Lutimonas sp. TaxID=1872403 RepID=UPI003D9BA18C
MITFFRKIRKKLATDNQFFKYSRYAFGEILLVVIGILLALQINNWNERKKEAENYKLVLEQIYNDVNEKKDWIKNNLLSLERQVSLIDSILLNPDSIPDSILPFALFYVDMKIDLYSIRNNQGQEILSGLNYNYDDLNQLKVTKQINSFVKNFSWISERKELLLEPLLNREGIPSPSLTFSFSEFNNFKGMDKSFFNQGEIDQVRSLIRTTAFKSGLRTLKASRLKTIQLDLANTLDEANSLLQIIKSYNPEVRLLYKDIGIVGSALESGWDKTVYMKQTDREKSVWVIEVQLNDGELKFRSSDSWTQNWGGSSFPEGDAIYYFEDIPVKAGFYRVTLNLENKTYQFDPLEK